MATSDFQITQAQARPIAVVRGKAPREALSAAFGESFGTVFGTVGQQGIQPQGMPLVRYLAMSPELTEFEAGVEVSRPVAASGPVVPSELPSGAIASCIHSGSYDALPEAHEALTAWIAEQGRQIAGAPWEQYINDPGEHPDPATWQTRVNYPLV